MEKFATAGKKLTRLYIEDWSVITLLVPKCYDQTAHGYIRWSERVSTVCVSEKKAQTVGTDQHIHL